MRQLIFILFSILLSGLLSYLGSWWLIIFGPFIAGFILRSPKGEAFGLGFLSIFLLWGILIVFYLINGYEDITLRIAKLLPMGGNRMILIFITLFLGGLLGGLAALNAAQWRTIIFRRSAILIEDTE